MKTSLAIVLAVAALMVSATVGLKVHRRSITSQA